jgi:hypothetical protein
MTREAQSKTKLLALLADGALPASACSRAFLDFIAPLLDGGVLAWQRSGVGRRLAVCDGKALNNFCGLRFPNADLPDGVGSRAAAVGLFRDSKATANSESEIISVRVWREDALCKGGERVGAKAATIAHGMFSFPLTRECPYELRGQCALVENPAMFAAFEQLHLKVGAVVYGHGRISNRTIDWLAQTTDGTFSLLHLPDYDPVGLSEFQRLRSRLGERVVLHLPPDLEMRFDRFSKRKLLAKRNSQVMLAKLRKSDSPEIRRVVELIDRYNAGLEQEALII